jgi:NadR type nicotinamide-nucleotide adenylyltransferase
MPPTTGHLHLLQFANKLAPDGVVAIINTQPHEPFPQERARALRTAIRHLGLTRRIKLIHYKKAIEQDPATPGFWEMWRRMMIGFGITPGDIIVASERYGKKLAEITGTQFFPYDIDRAINPAKATFVRTDPLTHFSAIIPEFQSQLRTRVTIFGAESTGKTTMSRELAKALDATWLFEYARPYLEETVNEITPRSMTAIWQGQRALQMHAAETSASPFVIQDTDLFSTVGYWQFPH